LLAIQHMRETHVH